VREAARQPDLHVRVAWLVLALAVVPWGGGQGLLITCFPPMPRRLNSSLFCLGLAPSFFHRRAVCGQRRLNNLITRCCPPPLTGAAPFGHSHPCMVGLTTARA
jgi:hypothetical protein